MPGHEPEPSAPVRRIGPYRLLRELGHGGMGTVYLAARADEHFHKRVALKVIRRADSAEVVRHFKRERQILASLEHPNIARLLDGGTTDDGLPYFVMEHIEGQQILDYCDSRSLSVTDRLKLFQPVCSAVQYAHRNLVVHRDIKPGNILVTADGIPKLLDFGIAKLLNPELSGEAATATSMQMTPAYASPEQVRGEHITTASDVYSLGVVLYELLTGRHPYRLASGSPLDVMKAISEQEPEKPSAAVARGPAAAATVREARRHGPVATAQVTVEMTGSETREPSEASPESVARTREGTPDKLKQRLRGDLDNVLLTALSREPQQRYASVEALFDDVRRHLEGLPVKARKPTASYRAGKFVRRHALGVAASAAVMVLLASFGAAMAVQSARVAWERDLAERERATAQKERETAQRVAGFLVDLFKVSDPSEARGNTITAREVLDRGAEKIANELKDQPEVRATLMDTMGSVYRNLGLYSKAAPLLEEVLAIRKAALGPDHPDLALSLSNLASAVRRKGDFARAEALFREALAMRRRLFGKEHPEVAASLNDLASVLFYQSHYAEAEAFYREALAMRRKLLGNEHPDVAMSLNNLGIVLDETGRNAEAEGFHREALAMRRRLGSEHRDTAISINNLGVVLAQQGRYAEAVSLLREGLAMRRKLLGNEHPDVALAMDSLAQVLKQERNYAEAEALERQALAMERRLLGPEHLRVASTLLNLGETLALRNKPAAAESLAREALGIFRRTVPDDHPLIAMTESLIGACRVLSRRYAEAEPLLLRSHAALKAKAGGRSSETRKALERVARLYEAWGKPEQAGRYRAELSASGSDSER